jgi:hypothetical protein
MVWCGASWIEDGAWTSLCTYVGLDVHKDTIVDRAEAGQRGEVREHGTIANKPAAMKAEVVKLAGQRTAVLLRCQPLRI